MARSSPRRSRGPVAVGAGTLALVVALAGCGGSGRRAGPTTTPAAPTTSTTTPSVNTPLGARLAIGTAQGMEIWSAATGVFTVGPTVHGVEVSHITWSPDGRYLSWQTVVRSHRRGAELWSTDVATGATSHWGPLRAGATYGPVVLTDAGVLTLGSSITRFAPHSGRHGSIVAVPAVVPPAGATVESWDGGWVIEPGASPTGQRVVRVTATGAPAPPAIVLDAGTDHGPYFGLEAVDRSGTLLAAELGTHGAGCERSGTSALWMASLSTGSVRFATPPSPGRERTQRFWNIDVSGPHGTVYASVVDCSSRGRRRGQAVATVLLRLAKGRWHRVGANLIAGTEAIGGPTATLRGDVRVVHGKAEVTGPGTVDVAGRTVATGGQALAWDPVRDIPSPRAVPAARSQPGVHPAP